MSIPIDTFYLHPQICLHCGTSLKGKRIDAKFCSANCSDKYHTLYKGNFKYNDVNKKCNKCGKEKPETDFYLRSNGQSLRLECKKCTNQKTNNWRLRNPERTKENQKNLKEKHPERYRKYQLKYLYGLTQEQYFYILKSQNGKCAICNAKDHKLHVDHCHKTNTVRGLLCGHCNRMIGCAFESEDTLRKAADYVSFWHSKR